MTDNRTTELLCKLLEERGIEWSHGDAAYETEWSTPDGRHCSAMYWNPTFTVLISGCTPEQAIAATLGSGTLTAKQVEKATYANSIHADCVDADWQAIADELNAELGSGTCKPTEPARCLDGTDCPAWLCSECGELFELGANFCSNCGAKVVSA